jgi:putative addiction module component (TIGR02574 family)
VRQALLVSITAEKIRTELAGLDETERAELAHFLIQSLDHGADEGAEAAWDAEIRDHIRAIDEGRITGVAYEDVMRAAESRLVP